MDDGLERISRVLIGEAQQEKERILGESGRKAGELLKAARDRTDSKKRDIFGQAKREAEAFRENELAKARMGTRVGLLNAKDSVADKVFERALEELVSLKKKKDYVRLVSDMVCRTALEGEGELVVSEEDSRLFGKGALSEINSRLGRKNAKLSLSKESRKMAGGFVLSYPQRGIELNRTFESILEGSREKNMPQVAKVLFEERNEEI